MLPADMKPFLRSVILELVDAEGLLDAGSIESMRSWLDAVFPPDPAEAPLPPPPQQQHQQQPQQAASQRAATTGSEHDFGAIGKPAEREQSMRPAGFGDDDRYIQDQQQQHRPTAAAVLSSAWSNMTRGVFKAGEGGAEHGASPAALAAQPQPQHVAPPAVRVAPPLAPQHGLGVRRGSHSAGLAAEPPAAPALSMAAFTSTTAAAGGSGNAASQRSIGRSSGDSIGRQGSGLRPGGRAGSDAPPPGAGFSLAAFTQGRDPHADAAAGAAATAPADSGGALGAPGMSSPPPAAGQKAPAGAAAAAKGWSTFTSAMAKVGKGLME